MKIITHLALPGLIALGVTSGLAFAADKTKVNIAASIIESAYVAEFTSPVNGDGHSDGGGSRDCTNLAWLEDRIEEYLLGRLSGDFRFLEFATVSDEVPVACDEETAADAEGAGNDNYVLSFRLDRAASDTEAVGFHITLDGPEGTNESVYLPFRNDQAAGDALGNREALKTEIELRLNGTSMDDIAAVLLKSVALPAAEAELMQSPLLGWMMPFTRSELCIDKGTVIVVKNLIPQPQPFGAVERDYVATALAMSSPGESRVAALNKPVFTEANLDQPRLSELQSADPGKVVVQKIYVIQYRPINEQAACDPLISPADVDFGGGS